MPAESIDPTFDVLVLGAGAAGLMAAIEAARRGRRTLLLDHADKIGKKILISGGGRCNFTNTGCTPENYLSENPHFARSALARYTPADFIAKVEAHAIPFHEKTLGQLFCDRTARDIVSMLERECVDTGVRIQLETSVTSVTRAATGDFVIVTDAGTFSAQAVIVATGGLSIPKMGATGFGYDLARQFGLKIVEPRPGLVPLVFSGADKAAWCDLSGLSTEVVASAPARKKAPLFREKLLVTHRGLSGPAGLQISSYWSPGEAIALDLAPNRQVFTWMLGGDGARDLSAAAGSIRSLLPARLAERWLQLNAPRNQRVFSNAAIEEMEQQIHRWELVPAGTEGYEKAEVTAGGIDTAELDPRSLEARKVPGLYFIGEVVDVTGWLGGYNFQWAWASGFCAGSVA
jgi:predicted Rossmann fold flavoprotein